MELIITDWALSSYIELLDKRIFTKEMFQNIIRPDVLLLKEGPRSDPKFENGKFWGPATLRGRIILNGWKMKWHNFGNGKGSSGLQSSSLMKERICVRVM